MQKKPLQFTELIAACAYRSGTDSQTAEKLLTALIEVLTECFISGRDVTLGREFGGFSVKRRDSVKRENSPKTPKKGHYTVVFKTSGMLKKRLKGAAQQLQE